jgi:hypothetical protein
MRVSHSPQEFGSSNRFGSPKVVIDVLFLLSQNQAMAQPISSVF